MKSLSSFLFIILTIFLLNGCNKSDDPVSSTGVTLVNVNGSLAQISRTELQGTMFVTDQNNNPITSITSSNVSAVLNWVGDGNVNGTVSVQTGTGGGQDIAAVTTMDYSGSMGSDQILCMENGVKAYINAMKTTDLTEIIKFDDNVIVVQPFTSDKGLLTMAVDSNLNLGGSTALYQSIFQGTEDVKTINPSQYIRCVVAFTDGGENASAVSREQMISNALTSGIPIYTIGLLDYYSGTIGSAGTDMRNIADTTGGFYFRIPPDTCSGLNQIYNTISGQLNNAYSITITWPASGLPAPGTTVTAVITVAYNNLTASFQKQYIIM